jgi:hypothetical protein
MAGTRLNEDCCLFRCECAVESDRVFAWEGFVDSSGVLARRFRVRFVRISFVDVLVD